jgi:hypothetical protein
MCRVLTVAQEGEEPNKRVIDYLESVQAPGLPNLDRAAFRSTVTRFCELSGIPVQEVSLEQFLSVSEFARLLIC